MVLIYMERTGALYIGGTLRHAECVKRLILFGYNVKVELTAREGGRCGVCKR